MAKTVFGTSHALRVEKWSALMFQYPRYKAFFSKFIGPNTKAQGVNIQTSPNALCELKADFKKGKGDKVTFGMRAPFRQAGIIGDNMLEGNEEAMTFYDWNVELKQTRHAATNTGELDDKRVIFDVKMQAKDGLGEWLGHRIDDYCLAALSGLASDDANVAANTPSTNRILWCGQTTADAYSTSSTCAAMTTATDYLFGPRVIEAVKRKALVTEPKIRPVIVDGRPWYVIFIHPYQVKALKSSTAWQNGHLYADVRGMKNALFSGALGAWDGVVIHEWEKIETRYGEGGTTASEYFDASGDAVYTGIYQARALFCGAQAVAQAWGKLPYYRYETFDYQNRWGVAVGAQVGVSKPEFNSEDYGVIVVNTCYQPD